MNRSKFQKIVAVIILGLSFSGAAQAMQANDIAVIGWGSLIWNPAPEGRTALKAGQFQQGGPALPIAFARVSQDGPLTLVIDPVSDAQDRKPHDGAGRDVTTWYAISRYSYNDLDDAIKNLREREGSPIPQQGKPNPIGYVNLRTMKFRITQLSPKNGKAVTIRGSVRRASADSNTVDIEEESGIRREVLIYLKRIIAWTAQKGYAAAIWTDLQKNFKERTGSPLTQANAANYLRGLQGQKARLARKYLENAPANVREGTRDGNYLLNIFQ